MKLWMQNENFRMGTAYEGAHVEENGINHQGSIVSAQSNGPSKSNYYGHTTVSGINFQGDMPPELARELMMMQQQQQLDVAAKPPPAPVSASKPITSGSNVHSFAGSGNRLGN